MYLDNGTVSYLDDVAAFNYTEIDWYKTCKEKKEVQYETPYVDDTIGILMDSLEMPILDQSGNFLGAISVDIDMSEVQKIISDIKVGETGSAVLLSSDGAYLTHADADKVLNVTIKEDKTSGYQKVSKEILENANSENVGFTKVNLSGEDYKVAYKTIDNYNWIVLLQIKQSEINTLMTTMVKVSAVLILLSVLVNCIAIAVEARHLTREINKVRSMSLELAKGNFTVPAIQTKSRDEIGQMTGALNEMLETNREVITSISKSSGVVDENCAVLGDAVSNLLQSFEEIQSSIREISDKMMDNSASTEEVTASIENMNTAVNNLASRAVESEKAVEEIRSRASKVEKDSEESSRTAIEMSKQFGQRLSASIEESKVVDDIGTMATAISDIADQINLLALNASIEAARAGDAGRGFAVVANEIGSLAGQTADTVNNIKDMVCKVEDAVRRLATDSNELVHFIDEKVTPDYQSFVEVAKQYGMDAESIGELSAYLSKTSADIEKTIAEMTEALQIIANASQTATEESAAISGNVEQVNELAQNVGAIAQEQKVVTGELDEMVGRFKIK